MGTSTMRIQMSMGAAALMLAACGAPSRPAPAPWSQWGGDKGFTRYAALDQIDRDNAGRLTIVWRRPAIDSATQAEQDRRYREMYERAPDSVRRNMTPPGRLRGGSVRGIPIIVDSVLYVVNHKGLVDAIHPGTGITVWSQQPRDTTQKERSGFAGMGLAYWRDSTGGQGRLIHIRSSHLYALDPATGQPVAGFGQDGRVDLRVSGKDMYWSGGPSVVRNVVIVAGNLPTGGDGGWTRKAMPEDVRGYDVRTGALLWTFHVVPREGEFGLDTWKNQSWKDAGNLGQWGGVAVDDELGYAYVPLSAPTAAYYGGHRPGDNLFANSLVAINAMTGERVWHFQTVHHDLWEYDLAAAPVLGTIRVDGKTIKAVMQASKAGFVYVFDRATGEPVWPIEERPVPQSTMAGEASSPTQPFPTKPAPFDRQGLTTDDLIDWPGFGDRVRARADSFLLGPIFTPPVLEDSAKGLVGLIQVPGIWGAGSWNTGAFDPESGYYYAVSHTLPIVMPLRRSPPTAEITYWSPWGSPDQVYIDSIPIVKPPWGRITAIDMNRGEHAWQVPNGDASWNHPALEALNLPPTGIPSRTVALVTKTLLFVGDNGQPAGSAHQSMWGKWFRAYDKSTGTVISEIELPAGLTGAPMTYMYRGKQYIVLPIGGPDHPPEWIALGVPEGGGP